MPPAPHRARYPLAAWVFPVRNLGKSTPLMVVIMLAVLLIAGIVAVMNSIPLSVTRVYGYSRYLTGATPRGDMDFFPVLKAHFETSPIPIERTVVARTAIFNVKSIVGPWPFVMHGLTNEDAEYIIKKANLGAISGRLPIGAAPECVITRPIAKNLSLEVGSTLLTPADEKNYSPSPVRIVGILDSEEWFALMPYAYLKEHHFPPVDVLMLFAPDQLEQRRLDKWAEESLKGQKAITYTFPALERDSAETFRILFRILNLVIGLLVTVITIMMAMLINIYLSQRTVEFGLLQAIGVVKARLVGRAIREAYLIVVVGWALGVLAAYLLLSIVRATLMEPRGFYIDPLDPMAYAYTIPIPVAIVVAAAVTVWVRFKRFDPISVVERRIA